MNYLTIEDAITVAISCTAYLLPGLFISRALTDFPGHLTRALPLSICSNFLFYQFVGLIRIRQSNIFTVLAITTSATGLLLITSKDDVKRLCRDSISHGTSVLSGALLLYIWIKNAKSFGSLIPNHDAMNHSYMIKNIVETGSQRVEDATRLFPLGSGQAGNFYPLGEHSLIASAVRLTGSSISGQMNLMVFLLAVGLFPYLMAFLCENLFPEQRLTARVTAPLVTLLFMFTFPISPLSWGGMGVIVAMAYVPGAAVFHARTTQNPTRKNVLLSTLLFVGLFVMHNTEAITAFLLSLLVLAISEHKGRFKEFLKTNSKIAILSMAALWPMVPGLLGGAQDRNIVFQGPLEPVNTFVDYVLRFFIGQPQFPLLLLIVASLILVRRKIRITLGVSFVALGAICIAAGNWPSNQLLSSLLKPWYGQVLRLNYNVVYVVIPLIVALVLCLAGSIDWNKATKTVAIVVFISIFATSLRTSYLITNRVMSHWYQKLVPNSSHSIAAYHYMGSNSSGVVSAMTQSDTISNSSWMYAISGVRPVNATAMTGQGMDKNRPYKIGVLENIGRLTEEPQLLDWLKSNDIKYFYFDENVNEITPTHEVSLQELRSDKALREVFSSGNAHVFAFNY